MRLEVALHDPVNTSETFGKVSGVSAELPGESGGDFWLFGQSEIAGAAS